MSNKTHLSLYNSKYLKYKNKYLSLKKMLGGSSLTICLDLPNRQEVINIDIDKALIPVIARVAGVKLPQIKVFSEGNLIELEHTAKDCLLVNNQHLTVIISDDNTITTKEGFDEVIKEICYAEGNEYMRANFNSFASRIVQYKENKLFKINLSNLRITTLPEIFGRIEVIGDLYLENNLIETLPKSFGYIKVGGDLHLENNHLETLPESFGYIKVGGSLFLNSNYLKTLPESFGDIKVVGDLHLENNSLKTLPESFGYIKVGGSLLLNSNSLKTLPESFGDITVGYKLNLENNQLKTLPESFGNIKNVTIINLEGNELERLPPNFVNIEVHTLNLQDNPNLPKIDILPNVKAYKQ